MATTFCFLRSMHYLIQPGTFYSKISLYTGRGGSPVRLMAKQHARCYSSQDTRGTQRICVMCVLRSDGEKASKRGVASGEHQRVSTRDHHHASTNTLHSGCESQRVEALSVCLKSHSEETRHQALNAPWMVWKI